MRPVSEFKKKHWVGWDDRGKIQKQLFTSFLNFSIEFSEKAYEWFICVWCSMINIIHEVKNGTIIVDWKVILFSLGELV